MALAHETDPDIYQQSLWDFHDENAAPMRTAFSSPLVLNASPLFYSAEALDLQLSSIQILEDARRLFRSVLTLRQDAGDAQLERVRALGQTTWHWINAVSHCAYSDPGGTKWQTTEYVPAMNYRKEKTSQEQQAEAQSELVGFAPQAYTGGNPDGKPLYNNADQCVQMAALAYCQAVIARRPTSEFVSPERALAMWNLLWTVPLSRWKEAIGIFVWIVLAIVPSIHGTPHARFIKTLFVVGFMSIGVDNWQGAIQAANTGLRLQKWLRSGHTKADGS